MVKQTGALALLLISLLAACAKQPAAVPPTAATDSTTDTVETASTIQIAVASDDFAIPMSRIPFILFDGLERVADAQQVKLTSFDLSEDPPLSRWTGTATGYNDYEVPYWVAYPELPQAGFWGLSAEITLADGTTTLAQFTIEAREETESPDIGDMAPLSENRTLATEPNIEKLTSGHEPNPAFYQMTVAEAAASGRPTVLTFATPAFCQTAICAPVLNSAEAVYKSLGDKANFIHLEIYKEFNPELVLADEVTEWRLSSEPWTYVLDSSGRVAARLGGPVSPGEITAALEPLLP